MAPSSASASASTDPDGNIDDMFSHLELNEDELDDVVISAEDATEYQEAARWLAIGRVHTNRSFSADALFAKLKVVWNLSRDPICREAGENLFIFQMHCLGDWKKVVHQGPWTFRGWGVLIEDYDGLSDPESFEFGGIHVWAQIHGFSELYLKQEVLDDLTRRVGKVREVQMFPKLFFEGNYARFQVRIDITRPLMRFVSLTLPEGKRRLPVKYEKIPFFCKRCGLLGHDHEECGDGVWTEQQLQYGTWMLVVRRASQPTPAPRRLAPRPLHGGLVGRSSTTSGGSNKRSSDDADLDDVDALKETANSPIKPGAGALHETPDQDKNAKTRRQLNMNLESTDGKSAMETDLSTEGNLVPPPPLPYVKSKDRTKARRTANLENDNDTLATSVAPLEGDRRAQ
ncbi:hypothetical protein QYE76_023542 [Lolium multiflorum]|uniref:Zinc knuckle CX2CX4HX4C domain-containing protein n=1 Tax=Lolium multiflorum TaxID=4521 RepID=A0AAD8RBV7_LOLMU|nr:hypothetical protein QYE76_023542 [Lolium multiflorum]